MWAAQYFRGAQQRTFLTSGGLGTMGFGFPAAIGAQKAYPNKTVLCITSEGSFQMNLQELAVAAIYKLPVKIILLNNQFHGMVRQWQDLFYEGRYASSDLGNTPDFVKLAEAYGILGLHSDGPSDVEAVLKEGLKHKGPVLMNFAIDRFGELLSDDPGRRGSSRDGAGRSAAHEDRAQGLAEKGRGCGRRAAGVRVWRMEHIISVLVENKAGVLARVAGLFSARNYNIESLSVAPTPDSTISMITIVTSGDEVIIEQIMKQLNKVIEVLKVVDLTEENHIDRETALIKIGAKQAHRDEAIRIAQIFPRQHRRLDAADLYPGGVGRLRQDSGGDQSVEAHGHQGDRPHRPDRHRPGTRVAGVRPASTKQGGLSCRSTMTGTRT